MGRIKSSLIKRTARKLIEVTPASFDETFNKSKKSLGRTMPSKKVRNKIAGYIARLQRRNQKKLTEVKKETTKNSTLSETK